jgi:hypothetical protein
MEGEGYSFFCLMGFEMGFFFHPVEDLIAFFTNVHMCWRCSYN